MKMDNEEFFFFFCRGKGDKSWFRIDEISVRGKTAADNTQ